MVTFRLFLLLCLRPHIPLNSTFKFYSTYIGPTLVGTYRYIGLTQEVQSVH